MYSWFTIHPGSSRLQAAIVLLCPLAVLLFANDLTGGNKIDALENTIYISLKSENGDFADTEYRLNGFLINITDNQISVDTKFLGSIKDKNIVELILKSGKLTIKADGHELQ